MRVTRQEAFVELVNRMEPCKWYGLTELVEAAPPYSGGYKLDRLQISHYMKVLKARGLAENTGWTRKRETQWKILKLKTGSRYKSRYDDNYFCPKCGKHGKWIPKKLQETIVFPQTATGRLLCPFAPKGERHVLRTQPRGSKYRRLYNETHCRRI